MKPLYTVGIVLSICIFLFIAVRPIFSPYIVGTADGFAHMYRLVNFDKSLSEGIIRPRWVGSAALGYGAPLYIFNYSVPYYLADAIFRLGFTIQLASQIYGAITMIASFLMMYLLCRKLWGVWAGILAGLVYTFAPYHLLTLYSYGAWGEMLAFAFPPLILYLLLMFLATPQHQKLTQKLWFGATVVTWVLFILTHNISSFISSPVILLLGLILTKRSKYTLRNLGLIVGITVLLASFFLLPAILLTSTIKIPVLFAKEITLRRLYMYPVLQQVITSWSVLFEKSITYKEFTVGIPLLIVGLTTLIFMVNSYYRKHRTPSIAMTLVTLFLLSTFLVDPLSDTLYLFRPLQYVLYPYRFLFLATFAGSMLAGYIFRKFSVAGVCIVLLAVLFGYPFTHPQLDVFSFPNSYFFQPQILTRAYPTLKNMGTEEFLPATADEDFLRQQEQIFLSGHWLPQKIVFPENSGSVLNNSVKQESMTAIVNAKSNTQLTINTLYYPDWRGAVDNHLISLDHDAYGRIVLPVSKGVHHIHLWFGYGTVELVGITLSLIGVLIFIASLII